MKFLTNLRNVAISGFFFLLPVFVILIVLTKAWTSLTSVGARIAGIFGVKSIVGVSGHTIFAGLLLIVLCIVCGWLVRFSFVAAFSSAVEKGLSKYIPGYDTYKAMAEEKLQHKVRVLPYASAMIKYQDYWRLASSSRRTMTATTWCFFLTYRTPTRATCCLPSRTR